jgi:mannose-6-phosphate isomerase-like protein (cupin superfamily)
MPTAVTHLLGPDQGQVVHLLALGVRFLLDGERTGGAFSLVEHPLPPRALGAPLHTHHNEDEYSYVLEGRFGVQLGDEVLEAPATCCSSPAASRMRSGTPAMSRRGCWS